MNNFKLLLYYNIIETGHISIPIDSEINLFNRCSVEIQYCNSLIWNFGLTCCNFHSSDTCLCPPSPSNGYISSCSGSRYAYSYIYHYCNSGYSRSGNFYRRCQYGGNWTGSAPVCLRSELLTMIMMSVPSKKNM